MKNNIKFCIFVLSGILSVCQLCAVTIQTGDFDKDGNPDYIVVNKYYTVFIVSPGDKLMESTDSETFATGWLKEIVNAGSEKNAHNNDSGIKFGLSQIFNPPTFTPPGQAEKTIAGEENTGDPPKAPASLNQVPAVPWQSNIEKNEKDITISFSQEVQASKARAYKLKMEIKFTDSSKIISKNVLFNTGEEVLSTTTSPLPFFNINYEAMNPTSWISIPIKRAFNAGDKKIVGINSDPLSVGEMAKYTEYNEDRFSKAERWVSVGGLSDKGVCAILTKSPVAKIIFWKDNDCFSIEPVIRIEALPNQHVEWEWTMLLGRGLDSVSKVTDSGIYAIKNINVKDSAEATISYLPAKAMDGVSLDLTLNTPEGKMIMNKNKEFAAVAPQKPGQVKLNLSPEMKTRRYLMDLEFISGGVTIDQFSAWLNPPEKTAAK